MINVIISGLRSHIIQNSLLQRESPKYFIIMSMEKSSVKRQNLPLKEQRKCFTKIQSFISNTKNFLRGCNKMLNGNIREFVDKLWGGEELIYTYNGKKYFSQGYTFENGIYRFEVQQWEPEGKMLWYVEGLDHQSSLDKFLEQPLFDGKRFWDAEQDMEWVDD